MFFEIYKKSGFLLNETTIKNGHSKDIPRYIAFFLQIHYKSNTPLITKSRKGCSENPDFIREIAAHSLTQLQRSGGWACSKKTPNEISRD
jgi:hypothetical protein